MIELGAGYGRWGVRAGMLAKKCGLSPKLIFVECDPQNARNLREAVCLNGLDAVSTVHEAAISYGTEPVPFLVGHDSIDLGFGQCIGWEGRGELTSVEYFGHSIHRTPAGYKQIFVPPINFETIARGLEVVDLVDMDLQKAERELVKNSMDTLNKKVRRVHIGTHTPEIEAELREAFESEGWFNVWDFGCLRTQATPYGDIEFVDGVQGWINPRLS